jgi:hypothetical protein
MTDSNVLERDSRTHQQLPLRYNPVGILGEWFGRLIRCHVPVGYEDETGFHFGIKPAPNESSHSFDI